MFDGDRLTWSSDRIHQAIAFLAGDRRSNAGASADIAALAGAAGFDAERVTLDYGNVDRVLATHSPAVIRASEGNRYVVLLSGGRRHVVLLDHEFVKVRVAREALVSRLREPVETARGTVFDRLLDTIPAAGRGLLKKKLMAERYGADEVGECWLFGRPLSDSFWRHLLDAGTGTSTAALAATHLLRYVIFLLAWSVIGRAAISGRGDAAWLVAWILLLLLLAPIHYVAVSLQGLISAGCGFVLRQRLMFGALRLDSERLRADGAGRHLARVFEGDALESLGRSGGFLAFFALIEIALAALILQNGAGGVFHVAILAGWTIFVVATAIIFYRRHDRWSSVRVDLTGDLVENIVGHRTRLVQQERKSWHDDEDARLARYATTSKTADRSLVWITAFISRGWLVIGLLGLAPAILSGDHSATTIAIGLGGVVFAQQAMNRLALGIPDLAAAASAWKKVAPLFEAASQPEERRGVVSPPAGSKSGSIIDARSLHYQYASRAEPALRNCSLRIAPGDKLVLEGRSGSGKSTLASILAGLRAPHQGLLLFDGLDRATLGAEGWRRRAVLAPQFHENHVFSESFAFNLLMGRCWPPKPEDWRAAEELCEEIGLGELLARMPGGLSQMLGETGWRLSHGEQSRLFIGRALLQNPELVILDESLAALDSKTLQLTVDCATRRAPALVVIAHP